MSMMVGGDGGQKADINMTPMIDVLLVLIIIFMVITPYTRGFNALIPQQSTDPPAAPAPANDIVVTIAKNNHIEINQQPVELEALPARLSALFHTASSAHFFVRGDRDLAYQDVARVIDIAR